MFTEASSSKTVTVLAPLNKMAPSNRLLAAAVPLVASWLLHTLRWPRVQVW